MTYCTLILLVKTCIIYLNISILVQTDVCALGNVRDLFLRGTAVTNVSALGNVHTLDLTYTEVTDLSALCNVRNLVPPNYQFQN